jgi:SAM-dependent methyltransferase
MSAWAQKLRQKHFGSAEHPYRTFENEVRRHLRPEHTLLDAGCGRTAPVLQTFRGQASRLIGIEAVDFTEQFDGIELHNADLSATGLPPESVDVIMARSVVEHLADPTAVFGEFARVLRPGGVFVFLTANLWDYGSLVASVVPNRFHPWVVARTEGRREVDVFPTQYRANTRAAIARHAAASNLLVADFRYLGQYPAYLLFNGPLFLLGTYYEKTISRFKHLHWLRGWIECTLQKPHR